MSEVMVKVHRDLPPTRMWGYNGTSPGPTIESRSGKSAAIEWVNNLPHKHFLPIDHNLHGAEKDKPEVRAVVHVHGAKAPPESDGYPEDWYVPGKSATYTYPNRQEPATLWYHDHAMGINRLNIYAGLFGMYLIRDDFEDALNLPKGRYEIPLMIYDRSFRRDGSLDYPTSGMPDMPWVPEAFGEAMLVNGKLFPYLDVEPRKYRFRLLNAANGRFFHLSLSNGQKFMQIGTDQGLMPAPLLLDSFVIAPGERFDLILDFSPRAGERIVLKSDAFEIMQFRVSKTPVHDDSSLPAALRPENARGLRHQNAPHPAARIQKPDRRFHDHAAGRQSLGHARHRKPDTRYRRNLGINQHDGRLSSHPLASGPLPDPRPAQFRRTYVLLPPAAQVHESAGTAGAF